MKRRYLVGMALAAILAGTLPVRAEKPLLFDTLEITPWGFTDEDGRSTGILWDVAEALARESGVAVEQRLIPLNRLIEQLRRGQSDCTIVARSPFSEEFAEPIARTGHDVLGGVVTLAGTGIRDYDALKGRAVAMVRGVHMHHAVDDDPAITRVFTDDVEQSLRMLKARRVDAVAGGMGGILYAAARLKIWSGDFDPPLILVRRQFWLHCKDHVPEAKKKAFAKAAETLTKLGVYDPIWRRYLPERGKIPVAEPGPK